MSPQDGALDNDFTAPNMDIVSIRSKFGDDGRQRESEEGAISSVRRPSADLRTPMIFLIANMSERIWPNRLITHGRIFSNRQISGVPDPTPKSRLPNWGAEPSPCARIMGSTKGEFVPA